MKCLQLSLLVKSPVALWHCRHSLEVPFVPICNLLGRRAMNDEMRGWWAGAKDGEEMRTSLQHAMTSSLSSVPDASATRQQLRSHPPLIAPAQPRDDIPAASPFSLICHLCLPNPIFSTPSSFPLLSKTFPSHRFFRSPVVPRLRMVLARQSLVNTDACRVSLGMYMTTSLQDDRFGILVVIFRKLGLMIQASTTSL